MSNMYSGTLSISYNWLLVMIILSLFNSGPQVSAVRVQDGTGTIPVNPSGSDTTGCGSISSPCRTISYAVSQAVAGDDIIAAAGTYNEAVTIDKRIRLIGAGQGVSIIDGQNARGPLLYFVYAPASTEVRGFTLRRGTADAGGGIWLEESSLDLQDSTVQKNKVTGTGIGGGGLYTYQSSVSIVNTAIQSNTATSGVYGGGSGFQMQSTTGTLSNVTATDNIADHWGGGFAIGGDSSRNISNITILDSAISGNQAANGGALFITDSIVTVRNSTISANSATATGGGLDMRYSGVNNVTSNNSSTVVLPTLRCLSFCPSS